VDAELSGLICSGAVKNNERTYTLFYERVTKTDSLTKEEALAKLTVKYFSSHGPATLHDFVWWSGLPVSDARKSIEMIKHGLYSEKMGSQIYWFQNSSAHQVKSNDPCYLLPAYDEYLISYKDRSSALEFQDHKKTVSSNGIFRPSIIVRGKVAGIWKRIMKGERVIIEADFFQSQNKSVLRAFKIKAEELGKFLGKDVLLKIIS
jgi:hypothetical protein